MKTHPPKSKKSIRVEPTDKGRRIALRLLEASEVVNEEVFDNALGKLGARNLHKMLCQVANDLSLIPQFMEALNEEEAICDGTHRRKKFADNENRNWMNEHD